MCTGPSEREGSGFCDMQSIHDQILPTKVQILYAGIDKLLRRGFQNHRQPRRMRMSSDFCVHLLLVQRYTPKNKKQSLSTSRGTNMPRQPSYLSVIRDLDGTGNTLFEVHNFTRTRAASGKIGSLLRYHAHYFRTSTAATGTTKTRGQGNAVFVTRKYAGPTARCASPALAAG